MSGLLRVLHATSKPCVAIIAIGSMPGVLRKVTLSLGAFSPPRVQTSYHRSGKALTGWYESPDPAQSVWRPEMALSCKTHGILSISVSTTYKARLSGPARQPPFCIGLASATCNPLYEDGAMTPCKRK